MFIFLFLYPLPPPLPPTHVCLHQVAITMQRYMRGFVAKKRRKRLHVLNTVVTKMQRTQRMSGHRARHKQLLARRKWAATEVQRIIRGYLCRLRVQKIIEAVYDTGVRQLVFEKKMWIQVWVNN